MKPKVFITRKIPQEALDRIEAQCEVKVWDSEDDPVPREVLEKEITEVDGLLCLLTESVDQALLDKSHNLKVISNMAVGYNNIDIEAATKKGIVVTNTPDVLTETTADLTFALMMAAARRFNEATDFLKKGRWKTWSPMLLTGQDVYGATLGIIGMGRIAEAIARRAFGFNMNLLYHNRSRKQRLENSLDIKYRELDELLKESDFVVVMVPYSADTHNLISARELSLMKSSAVLINTARGGIVNEEDLYQALVQKQIWAAGLDVFEHEPASKDHPLLQLENVMALPHIGSASIKTRKAMARLSAENLIAVLHGNVPPHPVNKVI